MPAVYETKLYDLLWTYDPNWDSVPVIYAYEMYKNREGEWETSNDWSFSYPYNQEDIDWTIEQFSLSGIDDLWADEWFTSKDTHLIKLDLSPNARDFVSKLPHYDYQDLRESENA